jgi:hypothetical protein
VLITVLIAYGFECAFIVVREGQVQPIRLRLTGEPPEFSLAEGQRFHIFLSRTPHHTVGAKDRQHPLMDYILRH